LLDQACHCQLRRVGNIVVGEVTITAHLQHRAATYVYKILKGTLVAHLPIEFPCKLELVINLKTAKVLGLPSHPRCSPAPTR
jgi:hypothetical protein